MNYSDPKPVGENELTARDKTCVNCKFMVRSWNYEGITSFLFGWSGDHFYCKWSVEDTEDIDPVTGRIIKREGTLRPCRGMREYGSHCDEAGVHWQPSPQWVAKKENTFKAISSMSEIQ